MPSKLDGTFGLTLEAESAIRHYMMRLVVLPAALATILAFAGGFFLNDVIKSGAYNDAFRTYNEALIGYAAEVATAKATVDQLVTNAGDASKQADLILQDAIAGKRVFDETIRLNFPQIASEVSKNGEFIRAVTDSQAAAIEEVRSQLQELKDDIILSATLPMIESSQTSTSSEPLHDGGGNVANCPGNTAVTSVQVLKSPEGVRSTKITCSEVPRVVVR